MDNSKLLNEIGELIDKKLDPINQDIKGIKHQLDTVGMEEEMVNKRVEQSQKETIESLSELINSSYDLHEERLKKVEDTLHLTHSQ